MKILIRNATASEFNGRFHYRGANRQIKFLKKIIISNIAYANHQCEQSSGDPRASQDDSVRKLVKYLAATKNDGLILDPQKYFEGLCGFQFQQKLAKSKINE